MRFSLPLFLTWPCQFLHDVCGAGARNWREAVIQSTLGWAILLGACWVILRGLVA